MVWLMNLQMDNFIIIIMASKYREGWTQFTVLLQPCRCITVLSESLVDANDAAAAHTKEEPFLCITSGYERSYSFIHSFYFQHTWR